MLNKKQVLNSFILSVIFVLSACNVTKHVPEGEYLLDKAHIHVDTKDIPVDALEDYLRQTPNSKVLGLFRMQLGIYNIAGEDTASSWNKSFMRMGAAPVIYNENLTQMSMQQLQKVFVNKGYVNAEVERQVTFKKKKASLEYIIHSNKPYAIQKYDVQVDNPILSALANDTSKSLIRPGMLFDVDVLDAERSRLASGVREKGFYNFNKDFLVYTADSTQTAHKVDVTLDLRPFLKTIKDSIRNEVFKQYRIRNVVYYANTAAELKTDLEYSTGLDTVKFRDFYLIGPKQKFISLDALIHNTYIDPNALYNDVNVEKTYSALNSLGPIKYVNISFKEFGDNKLDCYIIIVPAKTVSFSAELEGTYTDSYWGVAAKLGGVNKNTFNGAETLTLQGRLAYEWQNGIWARELGGQVGLKFPRFLLPFGGYDFKRNIHANTEFTTDLSYQFRPMEFTASNVGAGMNYSWKRKKFSHAFELFNLSYMDFSLEQSFIDDYITTGFYNPYNYVNRFILRSSYSGSFSNFNANRPMRDYSTYRYSFESAGNLLYGMSHLLNTSPTEDGTYQIFGIRYSQYLRGEYNSTHHQIIDKNNRFVYHLGLGLGFPYGNADIIPYERRFFAGGANSVRGWGESKLGPGVYVRNDAVTRDYNQVGDIKLDLNMEYRVKLFYVFEGALFLDGGNVWTIKEYPEQPLGNFDVTTFMKQIAIAYGLGIRMDFSFFIARLDMGIRLFDPVNTRREQWRVGTSWSQLVDDTAFHIAIGYPF